MKSPEGNFRGFFCWNDFMDTFAATLFLITAIDPSHSFRMTINVSLIMKPNVSYTRIMEPAVRRSCWCTQCD